ncbi:hypothetical protein [Mucilaginibacter rubeus]|uniref:Uncharacterized protein n=1 Tax=Mucilaginibacter rubeus TaxID=2027860 RepID=A0A5C1HU77_9SPHI|nr:hypothetical protein [Mucilaginibacter rubeus]QEM09043.1 hypothetical protein DEO27_003095 [Mucilaginibacter rubeus]
MHKGTGTYELWDKMDGDEFPQTFVALVAQLLSENSLKNLGLIMENQYNREQFENRVLLLEGLETDEILVVSARFYEPNNTAISLLADALETWFYLLTKNTGADIQPEMPFMPVWTAYVRLLTQSSQLKTLRKIRSFWQIKTGYYTLVIQDISSRITKKDNKLSAYLQSLKKRRTSLRMLLRHLQSDPVFQLPPTDFKTLNQ